MAPCFRNLRKASGTLQEGSSNGLETLPENFREASGKLSANKSILSCTPSFDDWAKRVSLVVLPTREPALEIICCATSGPLLSAPNRTSPRSCSHLEITCTHPESSCARPENNGTLPETKFSKMFKKVFHFWLEKGDVFNCSGGRPSV